MDIRNRRDLRQATDQALANAPNEKKLVLLWAGLSALAALVVSLLTVILDSQIADTGGISGMQLRGILTTAQSVLSIVVSLGMPFWTFGYLHTALRISRGQAAPTASLLEGFRRFGLSLRLLLLEGLFYTLLAFVCMQFGSVLLSFTPLALPLYEHMPALMEFAQTGELPAASAAAISQAMIPMFIGCGVLYVIVLIPIAYRLRMAQFRLMDTPRCGALMAMAQSVRMTKGNCLALLKLDLSFWWFYLGEILVGVLCYGDKLLPLVGVELPMGSEFAFWLFYVLGLVAQTALYYLAKNRLTVTYAMAYNALQPPAQADPV